MRLLLVSLLFCLSASLHGARLEIVGLRSYTQEQLIKAVAGRLDYVTRREATPPRADDAAYLVQTYLQSHGLPIALVTWSIPNSATIKLTVDEGPTQFLGTVTVVGLEETERATTQFQAAFPETGSRRAFIEGSSKDGIDRVVDLMKTKGFWFATASATPLKRDSSGLIPVRVTVKKGPLITLTIPQLKTPVPPSAKLMEKVASVENHAATSRLILRVRQTIQKHYHSAGYTDAKLEMANENDGKQLRLIFTLTPGEKFKINSFKITGLVKTMYSKVRKRFGKLQGTTFNENKINKIIKDLISTGAFEQARLIEKSAGDGELDLTLHLKETKARGVAFSAGFGSLEGYILGAKYYDRNLGGRLWNLNTGIELTSLGVLGEVSVTDPLFLDRDLELNARLFTLTRDYDSYSKWESGFGLELSWDYDERYSLTLGLHNSFTTIDSDVPISLSGPNDYAVSRVSLRQIYDRRDDPVLTTRGLYAELDTSLGLALGDDSVPFFEAKGQISYYKKLSESSRYALGLKGGFIAPAGDTADLPIDLRTFLGGANTVRSFTERDLGPRFGGNPLGGTSWWVANAEYTRTIKGPIQGVFFIDAGALSSEPSGVFDADIEVAAGLGLRIDLPVGPIRIEYGRNLTRDRGEPSGAFHFAIGTTF